jgi:alcohol dehydrogenase (cytochrome c)
MRTKSLAGAFIVSLLVATALTPVSAADMTTERALNPQREPQNWILHHGNFQGHRFSQLKEINTDTVKNLKPVFTVALSGFQSGGRYAHGNLEATPLVEDGMMYVPDGWGSVYAIDVTAGKKGVIKWKMDPGTDRAWAGDVACCGINNRGVALWKDKVISIALDGRMFALNKATGEVVGAQDRRARHRRDLDHRAADHSRHGDRRHRRRRIRHPRLHRSDRPQHRQGVVAHLHHSRRRRARQRDLEGRQGPLEARRRLGVETATYDPDTDTFYQGIGNAGPDWDSEYRPGDNKWAASVLAINASDGKIKWGYQYTPHDPYDYDEISEHPIIDAKINGEDRKLVVHAARNGFFYALDRTNGSFITGKQYVDQVNWTPASTPRPDGRSITIPPRTCSTTTRTVTARAPSR